MVSMEASKRPRRGKAWPNVSLFGPGGEDGGELLRELAGEPDPDPKRLERVRVTCQLNLTLTLAQVTPTRSRRSSRARWVSTP